MLKKIREIGLISSRKEKEAILLELIKDIDMMKLIKLSIDPDIQFNIKKYKKDDIVGDEIINANQLYSFFETLINKGLTGNSLKEFIENSRRKMSADAQWVFDGVLRKNLRIGIGIKTFNKIISKVYSKEYLLREATVMTAEDTLGGQKHLKIGTRYAVEPKLDGERIKIVFNPNKSFMCYSRDGKEQPNYRKYLAPFLQDIRTDEPFFLDAEITHKTGEFDKIAGKGKAKHITIEEGEAVINLFDLVHVGQENTPYLSRKKMLHTFFVENLERYPHIFKFIDFETIVFKSQEDAHNITKRYVQNGYEGFLAKELDSSYEYRRTRTWLKSKLIITVDLKIVDFYSGVEGKKFQDTLGGLVLQDINGNVTDVGSGFSDEMRDEIWNNKDKYLGKIVEVQAQSPTKAHALRFPRFIRLRDDKSVPDDIQSFVN